MKQSLTWSQLIIVTVQAGDAGTAAASDIENGISQERHPAPRSGAPPAVIPSSAMNDDFEYALPAEVARLMAAPVLETQGAALTERAEAAPDDSSGSSWRLHSPAATQSTALQVWATDDGAPRLPLGLGGLAGHNTAPLAGAAAAKTLEESLNAQSQEPGSTVVVAPYDLRQSCGSRCTTFDATCLTGTVDGTVGLTEGAGPQRMRGMVATLLRQLDCFAAGPLFLNRFELLGQEHRRRGGVLLTHACARVGGIQP